MPKERYAREEAQYDEKMARRQAKEKRTGKKPGGRAPKEPEPGPHGKDQVNFTDEESRIMPVAGGGFEQAYNGQIGVEGDSRLIRQFGKPPALPVRLEKAMPFLR